MTLITVTLFGSAAQAQTDENERKAAIVPVENYFKAHATQNFEYLYKAFHPETKLMSVRDVKYTVWTFEEYVPKMSSGKRAAAETERKRRVESIDLTGGNRRNGQGCFGLSASRFYESSFALAI